MKHRISAFDKATLDTTFGPKIRHVVEEKWWASGQRSPKTALNWGLCFQRGVEERGRGQPFLGRNRRTNNIYCRAFATELSRVEPVGICFGWSWDSISCDQISSDFHSHVSAQPARCIQMPGWTLGCPGQWYVIWAGGHHRHQITRIPFFRFPAKEREREREREKRWEKVVLCCYCYGFQRYGHGLQHGFIKSLGRLHGWSAIERELRQLFGRTCCFSMHFWVLAVMDGLLQKSWHKWSWISWIWHQYYLYRRHPNLTLDSFHLSNVESHSQC